jgi:FkbM family methyltransferase
MLRSRAWTVEAGPAAGLKMCFPQNPDYISGTSEPPVQRELARRLERGGVFYDVGANVGFFSLLAARLVGDRGHVCAFEPHPRNAAAIADNARLNGMSQVRVFDVAIGASARRDELLMTEWDGGAALSNLPLGPSAAVARTEVEVVPLDEFVPARGLPEPTFVKIDVEGAELEVIEGMTRTITRCKPVLLYEVDDGDDQTFRRRWAELDDRVRALGYEVLHLESAYPMLNWCVGHSVALPAGRARAT